MRLEGRQQLNDKDCMHFVPETELSTLQWIILVF